MTITVSDIFIILATICGPVVAVQLQKYIERSQESRSRRLRVFQTLMATRAMRSASIDHVQSLNLIDLYYDGENKKDIAVRNAWAEYYDFLKIVVPRDQSDGEAKAHNERGIEYLVTLLAAMSGALGYNFNRVQLKRGGYYPQGHFDEATEQANLRKGFVELLNGSRALPIQTVFPQEIFEKQILVQDSLLKVLNGTSPLVVLPYSKNLGE